METKYVLKRGDDKVQITGKKVKTEYSLNVEEKEGSFFVTLPAFNISFYVDDKSEIQQQAYISLGSFLRYWFLKEGRSKVFDHMLELGFGIIPQNPIKRTRKKLSVTTKHNSDQYILK